MFIFIIISFQSFSSLIFIRINLKTMASFKLMGFAIAFVVLALVSNVNAKPDDEVTDIWEEVKNIRITELR